MKTLVKFSSIVLTLLLMVLPNAYAENMKTIDNLDIHYMAIGATFLTPQIAKAYGIERSRYNALINISVLDNSIKGKPAKSVDVMAIARNDLGQLKQLDFKQVTEGKAIYYLSQLNFTNEETWYFDVTITDGSVQHKFQFKQKFYVDQ